MKDIVQKAGLPSLARGNKWFAAALLKWNIAENKRRMPWKGETDPYKIWLSEVILQQTRVDQGLNYYAAFIKAFPDIHALANAPDEKVYKHWEGLGYYTRCKNLLHTARHISAEKNGAFPNTYAGILTLKGIGPYTAAAISSFAFNLPHAVVDGNVYRVLARIFGIYKPTDSAEGKKFFSSLAESLIDKKSPGLYNQAIMDFGATICKPVNPLCSICPFKKKCIAFLTGKVSLLPVKQKKVAIRKRWFYYLVFEYRGRIAIRQRTEKDIWQNLFEFFLIELPKEQRPQNILKKLEKDSLNNNQYEVLHISGIYRQQLSHQLINGRFIKIRLKKKLSAGFLNWVSPKKIKQFAFPRFINYYLQAAANGLNEP